MQCKLLHQQIAYDHPSSKRRFLRFLRTLPERVDFFGLATRHGLAVFAVTCGLCANVGRGWKAFAFVPDGENRTLSDGFTD
jgi:hypothetical protein